MIGADYTPRRQFVRNAGKLLISLNCVFGASLVPGTCLHRFVDLKGFIQQVPGEHGPPLCGGCMSLKLLPRARSDRVAQLKSQVQHGSTAKAALTLERSCPMESMAPVLAIVKMVAGLS